MSNKSANAIQEIESSVMEPEADDFDDSVNRRTEKLLQKLAHNLGERVKELSCLYGISELVEKEGISLEEIMKGVIALIPPSWQYPEITCSRILLEGQEFKTNNFRETAWKQASDIIFQGGRIGTLEVCYLKEKPKSDEGPFLKEERSLLNVITERLGKIIERFEAKKALQESEERYRVLTEHVTDGVTLARGGKFLFANAAFASMFGFVDTNQLIGKEVVDLVSGDFKKRFQEVYEKIERGKSNKEIFQAACISMDGREFWMEGRYNIIKWKGKRAVLGTIRDITETKLREIAMEEEAKHLRRENIRLKSNIKDRYRFRDIIGNSPAMQEVYEFILKASASDANVAIYGETGTGKELIARCIHDISDRNNKTFVAVNCGAIPETLFESEFFGHRKGAFTGADADKHGFFDLAHKGTLFLDEVGELALNMQVKLLRAIEGEDYTPLGDDKPRKTDTRIVTATNRDLTDQLRKGLIREDFFYRIHVITIHLPPLRDRREDIPRLVEHFLKSYGNGKKLSAIPGKVMESLRNYEWPGNVRELQNVLQRYLTVNRLDFLDAPESDPRYGNNNAVEEAGPENLDLRNVMENSQKEVIVTALDQTLWHKGRAAAILGIDRKTLFRKMKVFGLN